MSRRKKNPLLGRILLVSVVAHIVALPVLAYFGAFRKIQASLVHPTVEIVPAPAPPEKPAEKPPESKREQAPAKKEGDETKSKAPAENLNQPKVAAAAGPASGGESGPSVNPQGTGVAGKVPQPTAPTQGGSGSTPTETKPVAPPKRESEPTRAKPAPTAPTDEPEPPKAAKTPVYVAAEPVSQPQPEIPDDLRAEALDKTAVVMITVSADGTASDVALAPSCGSPELDSAAVQAARRWKFRPATRDGEPVVGKVRLHVRFKVD